jgi:hypothetical protein
LVDATQERLLDREHLGDLPDGVERLVLVIERFQDSPPGNGKRPAGLVPAGRWALPDPVSY